MTSQVAITLLKDLEQSIDDYCELNDEGKEAFHMAITALELFGNSEQMLSVQSELSNNSQKLDKEIGKLISRQAAQTIPILPKEQRDYQTLNIDDAYEQGWRDLQGCIQQLPSVHAYTDLSSYSDKLWKLAYERGKSSAQIEVVPHKNYRYLSDYWCECGCHLGKKHDVKYCPDCGKKVKWDE